MKDGWNVAEGDPWSVTFRPMEDTRVVRLHVGDFTIVLPALEAHKLGSALHAASGLDAEVDDDDLPDATIPTPRSRRRNYGAWRAARRSRR
jgi:hypothetical protein